MRNYLSKAAIFLLGLPKNTYLKQRKYIIGFRILLILIALLFVCFYLRKIYEVPVNYTEIHVFHNGYMQNGELHFFLIRDYDRHKEASNDILRKTKSNKGGVYIEGCFYNKDKQTFHSTWFNNDSTLEHTIQSILDTSYFQKQDNIGEMVYAVVKGTGRQQFNTYFTNIKSSEELVKTSYKDSSEYYHYGRSQVKWIDNKYNYQNIWKIPIDTFFKHQSIQSSIHGYCSETYLVASKNSEAIPVFTNLFGKCFEKPNPFTVFEDVSKMVEIIRFPAPTWQYIKSLTIDYRCPTEFGKLVPEPDEYTASSIRYTDSLKLNKIAWDGLEYHVKFPDMENIQEIRIFALTTIATILFTVLVSLIYRLFSRYIYKQWKKYPKRFVIIVVTILSFLFILYFMMRHYTEVDYHKLDEFKTYVNPVEWNQ